MQKSHFSGCMLSYSLLFLVFLNLPLFCKTDYAQDLQVISKWNEIKNLLSDDNNGLEELLASTERNISEQCIHGVGMFITGLRGKQMWAMKMMDSAGKPRTGILNGNLVWSGSYSECRQIEAEMNSTKVQTLKGKYCLSSLTDHNITFTVLGKETPLTVKWGLCLPKSCSDEDVNNLVEEMIDVLKKKSDISVNSIKCSEDPSELSFTPEAVAMIVVLSIFGCLMLFGTLYDLYLEYKPDQKSEDNLPILNGVTPIDESQTVGNVQVNTNKTSVKTTVQSVILAFSVCTNGRKILSTAPLSKDSLPCIHGIRFISMTWVILGHTYFFGNQLQVFDNAADKLPQYMNRWTFQAINNATISVDTFFVLSGLLTAYLFFAEIKNMGSFKKVQWPLFYFHRFWRLTPMYMLLMGVYSSLFIYLGSGPFWADPDQGIDPNCKTYWWRNLLYINNLFPERHMCFPWSWYLSNDMQFYVITPLLFLPLAWKPLFGICVILVLTIISMTARGYITKVNHYKFGTSLESFDTLYTPPWTRIIPYLLGVLVGYMLRVGKGKIYLNKKTVFIGWMLAAFCCLVVVYGPFDVERQKITVSEDIAALYNSCYRLLWALGVCWVIFACVTGYGGWINSFLSWKAFFPVSRLTYSAYLVHPIVMYLFYMSRDTTITFDDMYAIYFFIGHAVLAYASAFVISLTFEAPFMGIEKALIKRR